MTKYFTSQYRRNQKLNSVDAKIEKAGFGEKEYIEKYGEKALHLNGIRSDSLILQLRFHNSSKALIHFDKKETIEKISKQLKINGSTEFEGLELKALVQQDRVVGVNTE